MIVCAIGLYKDSWGIPSFWKGSTKEFDGPVFFFLAFLRPGSARVRRGEEKKNSKHQHFSFFVWVCQIFYSTWNLKWWSGDSPSQVERKSNFFSNFPLHIYFKERDKILKCRERQFCLVCRERRFCAVEGDFAVKGDLQISSMKKDKSCEFFCLLKKIQNTIEEVRKGI